MQRAADLFPVLWLGVERLMKRQGIQALQRRRFRCCSKQEEGNKIATNILLRKFNPTEPNRYWCGDITYIRTTEGWRYLAVWMDLYSRRIIGWKIGNNMEAELVTKALNRALILRRINPSKLVIHTDQGSQHAGSKYQKLLIKNKINCSMSRKGNCWDNAAMESFFSTYKLENNLDDNSKILLTPLQLQSETTSWIEEYYNLNRRHSSNDYLSPIDYENRALKGSIINEQASKATVHKNGGSPISKHHIPKEHWPQFHWRAGAASAANAQPGSSTRARAARQCTGSSPRAARLVLQSSKE